MNPLFYISFKYYRVRFVITAVLLCIWADVQQAGRQPGSWAAPEGSLRSAAHLLLPQVPIHVHPSVAVRMFFAPPGSVSRRHGSESFCHRTKNKKTSFLPYCFVTFVWLFYIFGNDINVHSQAKKLRKYKFLLASLRSLDPDPFVRGTDPRIQILTKMLRICSTGTSKSTVFWIFISLCKFKDRKNLQKELDIWRKMLLSNYCYVRQIILSLKNVFSFSKTRLGNLPLKYTCMEVWSLKSAPMWWWSPVSNITGTTPWSPKSVSSRYCLTVHLYPGIHDPQKSEEFSCFEVLDVLLVGLRLLLKLEKPFMEA